MENDLCYAFIFGGVPSLCMVCQALAIVRIYRAKRKQGFSVADAWKASSEWS